ncbi:alcohol dehydrogenase [Stereum hirsutum FP-91666 SS1]|uniref:alcohol dehydrogenase n=1 Tax=Stereum hirsutum (strain FP-91666) TaxID=721885 RepID=UPI000444A006|nr:alcohol dehydrogenase [Stereum hirsutum FP-91666 SS1]EIM81800.1 alcohol dehydrogenase [Stereum hirsutum FP-91666 SS1]
MPSVRNSRIIFNEVPNDFPVPGKTVVYDESPQIDIDNIPLNGKVLVKTLVLSIDPYLRNRLRPADVPGYLPAFALGEPLLNFAVGVVVRSEKPDWQPGDLMYGAWGFQEYSIVEHHFMFRKIPRDEGIPLTQYVGVIGMPGKTAYSGWKEFSKAKKGETAFVSGASGAVGSFVVQLAKLDGLKVIACAGSDDKCDFVRSLGADVVFNYKKESTEQVLKKHGPIDIFWDNVGGETLDLALAACRSKGRLIECGLISQYNDPDPYRLKNHIMIFEKSLTCVGFLVHTIEGSYSEQFYKEIPVLVKEGKFGFKEDISYGWESIGDAIVSVQRATITGKKVVVVAKE